MKKNGPEFFFFLIFLIKYLFVLTKFEFLVSDESPYFSHYAWSPVKFYVQQMLLVKVISENVAKVR